MSNTIWNRYKRKWIEYVDVNDSELPQKAKRKKNKFKPKKAIYPLGKFSQLAKERSRNLIANSTIYEKKMGDILKDMGIHYFRQWIFESNKGFYIVDFYIPGKKIVIEVDGGKHYSEEGKRYDSKRSDILRKVFGIKKIYRFANWQVIKKPDFIGRILSRRLVFNFREAEELDYKLNDEYAKVVSL